MLKLTPMQTISSREISKVAPQFPKTVVELVGAYLPFEDLIEIVQRSSTIEVSKVGNMPWGLAGLSVYCSVKDPQISAAIKYCLSATEVDPKIKSQLIGSFVLNREPGLTTTKIRYGAFNFNQYIQQVTVSRKIEALSAIFDEMRAEGLKINLNHVDLSFLDLSGLNLNGTTAVGAEFAGSDLSFSHMAFFDLTNANMIKSIMSNADLTGSMMRGVILEAANLVNSKLRFVDFTNAVFEETAISIKDTDSTDLTGVITADESLRKLLAKFKKYFSSEIIVIGKVRFSSGRNLPPALYQLID